MDYNATGNAHLTVFATRTPTVRIDVSGDRGSVWLVIDLGFGAGEIRACYQTSALSDPDATVVEVVGDIVAALENVTVSGIPAVV